MLSSAPITGLNGFLNVKNKNVKTSKNNRETKRLSNNQKQTLLNTNNFGGKKLNYPHFKKIIQ